MIGKIHINNRPCGLYIQIFTTYLVKGWEKGGTRRIISTDRETHLVLDFQWYCIFRTKSKFNFSR